MHKYLLNRLGLLISNFIEYLLKSYFDLIVIVSDHDFIEYENTLNLTNILYSINHSLVDLTCRCAKAVKERKLTTRTIKILFEKYYNRPPIKRIVLLNARLRKIILSSILRLSGHSLEFKGLWGSYPLIHGLYFRYISIPIIRHLVNILKKLGLNAALSNEVFWGPYTYRMPDIIFLEEAFRKKIFIKLNMNITHTLIESAKICNHAPNGVFIVIGDMNSHVKESIKLYPWDVAPSVLAYMEIPIPHDTDGKIIDDILQDKAKIYHSRNYTSKWKVYRKIIRMTS